MNVQTISPVAVIHTDFSEKFGIPRQSTLVPELTGVITFEEGFRDRAVIRGIEDYSHLWLLWGFSESQWDGKTLTVHPPRLGGRIKKGVFATRSPFRPNGIGLSCVKLEQIIEDGPEGPQLVVSGIDMLDGTPIFDIKPYMPYSDCMPDAKGSFGQRLSDYRVDVIFPDELIERLPAERRTAAIHILEQDPRAAYNKIPGYVFGLSFAGYDIRFTAETVTGANGEKKDRLVVCDVTDHSEGFEKIKG